MNISVIPTIPSQERDADTGEEALRERSKPIDSKVKGLVLDRISTSKGGLLPSARAPQILIDLLPVFDLQKREHYSRSKRKTKLRKTPLIKGIPIGLRSADGEGWTTALMQFILFVPGCADQFLFTPRSFDPFREFIDQYHQDQEEKRTLSSADGHYIFYCLKNKWPSLNPKQIFPLLLCELHPKWEMYQTVEHGLQNGFSSDLFVSESHSKKQIFTDLFCYDLDAFIEHRPDGLSSHYFAYVKANGSWYQCDNERVTLLRSNYLDLPLQRALLLHYRRIVF